MNSCSDRIWPLPNRKHAMRMRWHDLLFMHWPLEPTALNRLLPDGMVADTFDGKAWIGLVPFRMSDVAPRGVPALPWLSAFPELNIRTYVTRDDKPGVWFFSLDATNPIAVRVARYAFHLPYMDARMSCEEREDWTHYASHRTHRGVGSADFRGRYRPTGETFHAKPGSLEHWLTARFCLYTTDRQGRMLRGEIDHPPWPLQPAECNVEQCEMFEWLGLRVEGEPHLLFSKDILVQAWTNELTSDKPELL